MNKDLNNIFNEMSKDDLMDFFKECGLEVENVEPGQGGFYLDGKSININEYSSFELTDKINPIEKYAINKEKLYSNSWNAINYIKNISNSSCNTSFNCTGYINRLLQGRENVVNNKLEESIYSNIDNKYSENDDFSKAA